MTNDANVIFIIWIAPLIAPGIALWRIARELLKSVSRAERAPAVRISKDEEGRAGPGYTLFPGWNQERDRPLVDRQDDAALLAHHTMHRAGRMDAQAPAEHFPKLIDLRAREHEDVLEPRMNVLRDSGPGLKPQQRRPRARHSVAVEAMNVDTGEEWLPRDACPPFLGAGKVDPFQAMIYKSFQKGVVPGGGYVSHLGRDGIRDRGRLTAENQSPKITQSQR